ncbi:hypothetical protein [Alloprevotella tannerae]|nr:hypothetical protein [Alloprevotella tannerae]
MNCSKHPNEPAVAQCVDCGRGMCLQCAGTQNPPLCEDCRKKHQSEDFGRSVLYVIGYTVLFFIGYKSNFMSTKSSPDEHWLSGYFLMAMVSGWQFLNAVIGFRLTSASFAVWGIYLLLKLFASAIVGIATAPITIIWNIIKIVRWIMRE